MKGLLAPFLVLSPTPCLMRFPPALACLHCYHDHMTFPLAGWARHFNATWATAHRAHTKGWPLRTILVLKDNIGNFVFYMCSFLSGWVGHMRVSLPWRVWGVDDECNLTDEATWRQSHLLLRNPKRTQQPVANIQWAWRWASGSEVQQDMVRVSCTEYF